MKRNISILLILLLLTPLTGCAQQSLNGKAKLSGQASAGVAAGITYQAISDLEIRQEPAYFAPPAAGSSYTDPQFGTTVYRLTQAGTEPTAPNTSYHTTSAAEHATWSKNSTKFYVTDSGNSCMPYQVSGGVPSRMTSTANATGDGGMQLQLGSEPVFSFENDNWVYGNDQRGGGFSDNHTVTRYDFSNDTYTTIKDMDELGFDLHTTTAQDTIRHGTYIGYVSNSAAAPTERLSVLFGGSSGEYHYLIAIMDPNGNVDRVINTMDETVGTSFNNDITKTGTVTTTSGTNTVTGSGTIFLTEFNPGNWIVIGGVANKITAVTDDTHITVASNWGASSSGVAVKIRTYTMNALANASALDSTMTGTAAINGTTAVVGTGTSFSFKLLIGQRIKINGETRNVATITDDTHLTVTSAFSTTASTQAITAIGCTMHNAAIFRDGGYLFLTNSFVSDSDTANVQVIYDLSNDTLTKVTYIGDGHSTAGFGEYVNQSFTHDAQAWYRRPANDVNTPASVLFLNVERCLSSCDINEADHTSWNNSTKTNHRPYAIMSEYRYGANSAPPFMSPAFGIRDNEIIGVQTDVTTAQTARVVRFLHTMTDIRSDAGYSTISGSTMLAGDTSVTVANGTSFAASGNLLIDTPAGTQEFCTYTGKSGNVLTGLTRGVDGTSAASHSVGVTVWQPGLSYFWYSPRGQVSPDGKYVIYTSNWKKTLGAQSNAEAGGNFREDVFFAVLPITLPVVSNVSNTAVGSITTSGATITFDGSQSGDTVVEYSTDLSYGSSQKDYTLKTTSHSLTLTGLAAGTTYNIRTRSRNTAGNSGTTQTTSFTTTGGASDFATDTFQQAANPTLDSQTADVGGTWAFLNFSGTPYAANSATVNSSTHTVWCTTSPANYFLSATPPSTNYLIQGDIKLVTDIGGNLSIYGHGLTTADSFVMIRYDNTGHTVQVFERVGGVSTQIGTDFSFTLGAGNTVTLKLVFSGTNGTTVQGYVNGTAQGVLSGTLSTLNTAGKIGFRMSGAVSSSTGLQLVNIHGQ